MNQPLKWKKPRKIFVCSMADLFHEAVATRDIYDVLEMVESCPQHTFMFLTKRPERMLSVHAEWSEDGVANEGDTYWTWEDKMPNLWLGVTAENQKRADERIPLLLQIPAAVRFVSVEPCLEKISFRWRDYSHKASGETYRQYLERNRSINQYESIKDIDWVIAGPETGPGARECKAEWIETLHDQCHEAGVPFFDKRDNYLAREWPQQKGEGLG